MWGICKLPSVSWEKNTMLNIKLVSQSWQHQLAWGGYNKI
jgi:hypothetical protein